MTTYRVIPNELYQHPRNMGHHAVPTSELYRADRYGRSVITLKNGFIPFFI